MLNLFGNFPTVVVSDGRCNCVEVSSNPPAPASPVLSRTRASNVGTSNGRPVSLSTAAALKKASKDRHALITGRTLMAIRTLMLSRALMASRTLLDSGILIGSHTLVANRTLVAWSTLIGNRALMGSRIPIESRRHWRPPMGSGRTGRKSRSIGTTAEKREKLPNP